MALSILVLTALAVGAVLLAKEGSGHREPPVALASHTVSTVTEVTSAPTPTESSPAESATQPSPAAGSGANPYGEVSQIETVLREFHRDVLDNDLEGAWDLTSTRYRRQKEAEPGGYNAWVVDQKSLQGHLDPSGLKVSIYSWEEHPQVAAVRITGMRWSAPRSPCRFFQGITWVHFENGSWYYEPGYSVSSVRRAQWEGRKPELLGWGCA